MNQNTQPLAPVEQSLLKYVETMRDTLIAAAAEANQDQTADRCLAMGAHCNHLIDAYIGLLPTAQLFSAAGFPRLAERLTELIAETQRSSSLWFTAVARARQNVPGPSAVELAQHAQQDRYKAQREAPQAQFAAWQKLHDEQQAAFDAQNTRWSENFNK
jgi:hypothetical protein